MRRTKPPHERNRAEIASRRNACARAFCTCEGLWTAENKPRRRTLRSIYFDTSKSTLREAGISLRVRREGRRWIQTVKCGRDLSGGLSRVREVEGPVPGGAISIDKITDDGVRNDVLKLLDGAGLHPVCEVVVRRSSGTLHIGKGTRAELAVDLGEVRAGGRSAALREAEIELIEGNPGDLYDAAQALAPDGGLRLSRLSKAERGFLLATEGRIEPPLQPRHARTIALDKTQTVEQAARDMLRECLDQIATNIEVVRELDDPEGPHQLRVGLRRVRSVLALHGEVFQGPGLKHLNDEARWLGREVGYLRDLHVIADERVRREGDLHPEEPALATLARDLAAQAAARREVLRVQLAGPRVQAFLLGLARFVETRGWLAPQDFGQTEQLAVPVAVFARPALSIILNRVRKHARHLERLTEEERHKLRKQLKKLRYSVELFSSLYPEQRVKPFMKRLKALQDAFGNLNDAVTVQAILSETDRPGAEGPGAERAIGWVIGANLARAEASWKSAQILWRRFENVHPFWRT